MRSRGAESATDFALRSSAFLLTDLKDSPHPDDRVGDITAYDLAQEHFRILSEVVAKQKEAIVKTIGDAVTATGAWGSAA